MQARCGPYLGQHCLLSGWGLFMQKLILLEVRQSSLSGNWETIHANMFYTFIHHEFRLTLSITLAFTLAVYCTFLKQTCMVHAWAFGNQAAIGIIQMNQTLTSNKPEYAPSDAAHQLSFVLCGRKQVDNLNFLPEFMHFNLLLQPLSLLWEAFHEMLEHEWGDLFLIVASETAKPVNYKGDFTYLDK